ncbi:MAG: hypothetical protein QGF20_15760 [Alphaproteobacteria bacterium]|nr:hypothetical protein [Alphaproteobacteria bacterium]
MRHDPGRLGGAEARRAGPAGRDLLLPKIQIAPYQCGQIRLFHGLSIGLSRDSGQGGGHAGQ